MSELIRLWLDQDELQPELEQKEARITELRNQLQARGDLEEQVNELVERTERRDDALAEVLEHQQKGVVTRARNWLFG